jgi:hypothetical protein
MSAMNSESLSVERQIELCRAVLDIDQNGALVDFAAEAKLWRAAHYADYPTNPLMEPELATAFIESLHKQWGVSWTWGGYEEDRTELWAGTYLDALAANNTERVIHCGVDINVPHGTVTKAGIHGTVRYCGYDYPLPGGWGSYVVIEPSEPHSEYLFIYGHLGGVVVAAGEVVTPESKLGPIGNSPFNGIWFPHLHFQVVEKQALEKDLENDFLKVDGYFPKSKTDYYKKLYPDPMMTFHLLREEQAKVGV